MNVGFGLNLGALVRGFTGADQGKINQQAAMTGAAANLQGQDRIVKTAQRERSMRLVGNGVGQRNVLDKAGVTKVAASKKR